MHSIDAFRMAIEKNDPYCVDLPKPKITYDFEYAIWRFINAWRLNPPGPDLAVLLRQVARWGQGSILIGSLPKELERDSAKAQVFLSPSGFLHATPFAPTWLKSDPINKEKGIDRKPELRRYENHIKGEPYLNSLTYPSWISQAQKEAAWMALTAPPRSTTLIALPTGSGKSLCFQILSRFGSGLTVVVVPTVALAIDQWQSALSVLGNIPGLSPIYFAASDPDLSPETVIDHIKGGTTRLVFTSPEACVSGRLRVVLEEAAQQGRLENLVIDEAHMIEAWGIYFRVDFQMLSMLRKKWMEFEGANLRTYLLSATFTSRCRQVLQDLYGTGGQWREFVSQRLRPEITYYQQKFQSEEERLQALTDCAWNLPRPAIFYTTEVLEAKQLAQHLRNELGFSRVGCFHGDTPDRDRRELLRKWRQDELDLMVATSAFGLGVDKPEVRAVVHACFPENLNRFYQEVGRTGRDGASSISILLPCNRDIEVAEGLAPKLLREETIQKRWEGLFQGSECVSVEDYLWKLRTDSRHMGLLGTRTWGENVRWNKRLILQLKRAGLLEILDIEYRSAENGEEASEWVKVRLNFPPIANDLGTRIKPQRDTELADINAGLEQMKVYLQGNKCVGRLLKGLYGNDTQMVCGGCRFCRQHRRFPGPCPDLVVEPLPPNNPSINVVVGSPNPFRSDKRREFIKLVRRCVGAKRLRRFVCSLEDLEGLMDLFDEALSLSDPSRFRLDALDPRHPLRVAAEERVVFFHINTLNEEALGLRYGLEITHLICEGVYSLDIHGRYPLESKGAKLEPVYDYWLGKA